METGVWISSNSRVKGTDLNKVIRKAMKKKDQRGNKRIKSSEVEATKERPWFTWVFIFIAMILFLYAQQRGHL